MVMERYCDKLRQILVATGWSQEALAGRLGVSFATLNSWVNGKSEPREMARARIDVIYADVMGAASVDREALRTLTSRALRQKFSAKKLASDSDLLKRYTTAFTYHTNATEGSTMTENDVREVVYENHVLRNRTAIEQREAINHQAALYFVLDELMEGGGGFEFTPDLIKALHLRLMNGIVSDAGFWRNHGVRVSGSRVARANYARILELIEQWCGMVNDETMDKIGLMARSHAEFERIHPFSDGNGRTGRLLLLALALKLGVVPPILRKERRMAYYSYLELANERGETDPLEMYIAESMVETFLLADGSC